MFEMSLYTLHNNKKKKGTILYEKLCLKLYLSDENTHEEPCPHIGGFHLYLFPFDFPFNNIRN